MGTLSVLLALLIMTAVAFALGKTDFSGVGEATWLGITTPFYFGIPEVFRDRHCRHDHCYGGDCRGDHG